MKTNSATIKHLSERWKRLCLENREKKVCRQYLSKILEKYGEAHRSYHTLRHVEFCLGQFDRIRSYLKNPDTVEAALWFHDVIYDLESEDNEGKSADFARTVLAAFGWEEESIGKVSDYILCTVHFAGEARAPGNRDCNFVRDIDLSILGGGREEFFRYEREISEEYSRMPRESYIEGRVKILEYFLALERIFLTDYYHRRFESAARENIKTLIENLKGERI